MKCKRLHWQFMIMGTDSAVQNMATDRELLDKVFAGHWPPLWRFYQWNQPAFSFGYAQHMDRMVDVNACRRAGIELVQRPTGGGLVIHGWDLTYTVIAPADDQFLPRGLLASYCAVHERIRLALKHLGIETQLAPEHRQPGIPRLCLSNIAPYDLLLDGQKIAGGAQRRRKGYVLHQGYIALDPPPMEILQLAGTTEDTGALSASGKSITREALIDVILQSLR